MSLHGRLKKPVDLKRWLRWFLALVFFTVGVTRSFAVTLLDVSTFAGADAGEKITNCIATLPSAGGGCDARGFAGAQSIANDLTISKSNVKVLLGPATFTLGTGTQILISGNGVVFEGFGPATVFDASMDITNPLKITGSDVVIKGIRIIGNRLINGLTTTFIADGGSRIFVDRVIVENSGGSGIVGQGVTDMWVVNSRSIDPHFSGIAFLNSTNVTAWGNYVSGSAKSNVPGHAGITCSGSSGLTVGCWIIQNKVENAGTAGIRADGGSTATTVNVYNVAISENQIYSTGVNIDAVDGEGIPFTASNVTVTKNRIDRSNVEGIKAHANCLHVVIEQNIISNTSQNSIASHAGIQLQLAGKAQSDIHVRNNIIYDDQVQPTTNNAVNIASSQVGGTIADSSIVNNMSLGTPKPVDVSMFGEDVVVYGNIGSTTGRDFVTYSQRIIMRSPDGSCSSCGPDNFDVWTCHPVICP